MADKKISALTAASTPLAGTEVLPIVQSGATVKVAVSDLTAGRAVSASQLSSTTKVSAKIATSGTYYRVYEILATGGTAIGEISYSDTNDTMRIANLSNYVNTSTTVYVNGADRMEIMPNGDIKALNGNFVVSTSGKGIDFSATAGTGTSELLADYEEGTFTPTVIGTSTAGTATYANQLGKYTKVGRLVTVEIYVNWNSGTGTGSLTVGNFPFTIGSNVYGSASIWGEISLTAVNYLSNRMLAGGTSVDLFNAPVGGGVTNPVAYQASGSLMITATYST
jgi:hypothetical protein